jgi:hypothetical protein
LLAVTIAVLVFPIAVVVFAGSLLGGSIGLGMSPLAWSATVSAGIGVAPSAGVFTWSLFRAEAARSNSCAWPYPSLGAAPPHAPARTSEQTASSKGSQSPPVSSRRRARS